MKVAIVAYEDGDPTNARGPISADIFNACWKRAGSPVDLFEFAASTAPLYQVGGSASTRPLYGDFVLSPVKADNGTEIRPVASIDYGLLAGQAIH